MINFLFFYSCFCYFRGILDVYIDNISNVELLGFVSNRNNIGYTICACTDGIQLCSVVQYFSIMTVMSREDHLAFKSLTYVELFKKDRIEEVNIFSLSLYIYIYSTSL